MRKFDLVVFDLDSTLIDAEGIDELARFHGVEAEVSRLTSEAMHGKIPFAQSFADRVALLKNLKKSDAEEVGRSLPLTRGAMDLCNHLRDQGSKTAILSGGMNWIARRVAQELNIDLFFANRLEFKNGICTGVAIPPIVDGEKKAQLLESIAKSWEIPLDRVACVGDGSNDIPMMKKAGFSISFCGKPVVKEAANVHVEVRDLNGLAPYLCGGMNSN